MKVLSRSAFSLKSIRLPSNGAMPLSEVLLDGAPTGTIVDGAILEAALAWHDLTLAFVTDDIAHEDTLRVYLFNRDVALIDWATLGAMYATGAFSGLEIVAPDVVRFRFMGGTPWTLTLMDRPRLTLPFLSDPVGVRRPIRLSRRFNLAGQPRPES